MVLEVLPIIQMAMDRVDRFLQQGSDANRDYRVALSAYMEAARAAIQGLLNGAEDILSEAATCNVKERAQLDQLSKHIDGYLHGEKLRPRLKIAIDGIGKCRDALRERAGWRFPWSDHQKEEVVNRLSETLHELINHLETLGDKMYGRPTGHAAAEIEHLRYWVEELKRAHDPDEGLLAEQVANIRAPLDYTCIDLMRQMTRLENDVLKTFR